MVKDKPKKAGKEAHPSFKKYTFFLQFGYAETCSTSYLIVTSARAFADVRTALVDLGEFFRGKFLETESEMYCCASSRIERPCDNFCGKCGRGLSRANPDDIDIEVFTTFIADSAGKDYSESSRIWETWAGDEESQWSLSLVSDIHSKADRKVILVTAENILASAIGLDYREGVNLDTILKDEDPIAPQLLQYWK